MINKNLVLAVLYAALGMAYIIACGVLGWNLIPAPLDTNNNPIHGVSAFVGIIIGISTIVAAGVINSNLNERDREIKERAARRGH